ncbi:hypothetical protein BESB_083430 [Besnoitia besnoiti]|uniref:Toxoplasma gondii family A protein n=1 Tax=Besnoitia besnoiti TaxID=94643 RepID=A0A2A9M7I4_BESBE|nr:hypothetical protein BESB_083430 [Besnoitia besnoiti]PFH33144.1 hypothetical protein BESB_083430 [Besnoitia besnoiti]
MAYPRSTPSARGIPLLRVLFIALLGILPCCASRPSRVATDSEESVNPHFAIQIPADGIAEDEQHEVSLDGSKVLQITDKTKKAVIDPQEFKTHAYAYKAGDGKCDVTKQVSYRSLFPKVPAEYNFWTAKNVLPRDVLDSKYTYTHPPADQLESAASFCIILKVPEGNGTSVKNPTGLASFQQKMRSHKMSTVAGDQPLGTNVSSRLRKGPDGVDGRKEVQREGQAKKLISVEPEEKHKTITVIVHSAATGKFVVRGSLMALVGLMWMF